MTSQPHFVAFVIILVIVPIHFGTFFIFYRPLILPGILFLRSSPCSETPSPNPHAGTAPQLKQGYNVTLFDITKCRLLLPVCTSGHPEPGDRAWLYATSLGRVLLQMYSVWNMYVIHKWHIYEATRTSTSHPRMQHSTETSQNVITNTPSPPNVTQNLWWEFLFYDFTCSLECSEGWCRLFFGVFPSVLQSL